MHTTHAISFERKENIDLISSFTSFTWNGDISIFTSFTWNGDFPTSTLWTSHYLIFRCGPRLHKDPDYYASQFLNFSLSFNMIKFLLVRWHFWNPNMSSIIDNMNPDSLHLKLDLNGFFVYGGPILTVLGYGMNIKFHKKGPLILL